MIRDHLGDPDMTIANPHYRNAAPMKLYHMSRIEAAEATLDMDAIRQRRATRSDAATKAALIRFQKTAQWAEAVQIHTAFKAPYEAVLKRGVAAREEWYSATGQYGMSARDAPLEVKQRWAVNYLRHECTTYDGTYLQKYGEVGVRSAHNIIKRRVLELIRESYTELTSEVDTQLERMRPHSKSTSINEDGHML